MEHTSSRSVLETSTAEFKHRFRDYLKDLSKDDDQYRVDLVNRLEWCFERWEYWRQKFFPDADLLFPFFQSMTKGKEFGHYNTIGSSGQPSVIHIKRSLLMGTSDLTIWTLSPTKKLVLKRDHPKRDRFIDHVICHELVHQYLHEASPDSVTYKTTEAGRDHCKGHGKLFAAEINKINQILHLELGFEFVPVRHSRRDHGPRAMVQRPSCAQGMFADLLFCWDPSNDDLTRDQIIENRRRLEQALDFFGGAIAVVEEEAKVETDFPAPFTPSCADVCIQHLEAYDKKNGTTLLNVFIQSVLDYAGASSGAPTDIQPASGQEPNPPSVPQTDFKVGDWVYVDGHEDERVQVVRIEGFHLYVTRKGEKDWLGPISDELVRPAVPTVPAQGDTTPKKKGRKQSPVKLAYPIETPAESLRQLLADIDEHHGAERLSQMVFGLSDGSLISRHKSDLKKRVAALAA